MKPAVAILAAGRSERLGECKALAVLGGATVLERLCRAARAAGAADVAVVAGADAERIAAALAGHPPAAAARCIVHPAWALGRTGSVAAAAGAFPGRDLLLAPVDVPLVGPEVFRELLERWQAAAAPARGWLAPRLEPGGRHGHPVLLGRELAAEAARIPPDAPLRVLRERGSPLLSVTLADPRILDDLDTPHDLERLRASLDRPA